MPEIKVKVSGALFKGQPRRIIDNALLEMKEAVANEGVNMVRQRFSQVFQNPTGYAESRVATDRVGNNYRISDNNVLYGPWLEGTGSRNKTTRFKGYHTFRIIKQQLQKRVPDIIQPIVDRVVRNLNK